MTSVTSARAWVRRLPVRIHAIRFWRCRGLRWLVKRDRKASSSSSSKLPTVLPRKTTRRRPWLHSHTVDGVVYVESPIQRTFTLGDYFDLWGQLLEADQVGTVLFYTVRGFSNFTLRLQFRLDSRSDNSGVFVRFRDPRQAPPPGLVDPRIAGNPAWLAVDTGFEVQIDEAAQPDQLDKHRTGAVFDGSGQC